MIGKLTRLFRPSAAPAPEDAALLASVANAVDPRIAALPGYEAQLGPALRHALDYYDSLVAAIPGPVAVSSARHGLDDVVGALFPAPEDVAAGLGRSLELRESLSRFARRGHGELHALMGIRVRRNGFAGGSEPPLFADHTFRSLGAAETDARRALREAALNGLLKSFTTRLGEERRQWTLIKSELQINKELSRVDAQRQGEAAAPEHDPFLDEYFARAAREFTPEGVLKALAEWLRSPETQLRLEAAAAAPAVAGKLDLPVLASNDRRQWHVCIARFPVAEAVAAVAREARAHRYILI